MSSTPPGSGLTSRSAPAGCRPALRAGQAKMPLRPAAGCRRPAPWTRPWTPWWRPGARPA